MRGLIIDVMAIPEDGLDVAVSVPSTAFSLESSDVHLRDPVDFRAHISRAGTSVAVRGGFRTTVEVPCVRCLEPAVLVVEEPIDVVVLPISEMPEEDEKELAAREMDFYYTKDELDLKAVIWDHLAVVIPIQPLCRSDCKGLCPSCGTDLNRESCDCPADDVDERLEVLKKWHERHHRD